MKAVVLLTASAWIGASATQSYAGPIVDQANTPAPWTILQVDYHTPMGQEFVPNHTAVGFIDVFLEDAFSNVGSGADFQIRLRNDAMTGAILGTSQVVHAPDSTNATGAYQRFNFVTPVSVIPAHRYVLEMVTVSSGTDALGFGMGAGQTNTYLAGRPIVNGSATTRTDDFLFRSGRNTNAGLAASGTFAAFAYRGIFDADRDGDGDSLQAASFVSRHDGNITAGPSERRAVFEYDVARFAGGIQNATISGTLYANNSLDTGTRTVQLELFDGDGNVTVSDFQIAATPLAQTISYHPPTDSNVPFTIDITSQLNALLAGGADFLGARFTPANPQAPSVFSDADAPVLNVVVPEPGAIGFAALALGAGLLRRRCRSA